MDRMVRAQQPARGTQTDIASADEILPVDLASYAAAARRHKGLIASVTALTAVLTLALAMAVPRAYEAATRLKIDPRGLQVLDKDVTPRSGTTDQIVSVVESEMRVISSDVVLLAVIKRLGLNEDAEFNGTKRYVWSFMTDAVTAVRTNMKAMLGVAPEPVEPELATLRTMQKAARVRREPQSFVVDLIVRTEDAAKSTRIADAIAAEYLDTRSSGQSGATQRASDAMSGRLDDLRRRLEESEARAEQFKRENELVVASGRLVSEQQLSELNTQLVVARGETSKAGVRLEQIRQIRQSGVDPDSVAEALQSETIVRLKTQSAAIRRREASLLATLLPSHPLVKQVRQEMADARRQISEEVARISEAARLDVDRTRNNERTLERNLTELKTLASAVSEKQVKLRELEREVEANRAIYTAFLTRGRELSEQRRLDTSLAVVLSPAVPPKAAIGLPMSVLVPAGLLAGLGLGLGAAMLRDRRDPVLRGADQLERLGARGRVTLIPGVASTLSPVGAGIRRWVRRGTSGPATDDGDVIPSFVTTDPNGSAARAVIRLIEDVATAAGRAEGTTVLVTAAAAMEGKSTIAVNLALAAAKGGDKVLLIDGDLEQRSLSVAIDAASHLGLSDVIAGKEDPSAVVLHVVPLGIDVLPAGQSVVRLAGQANRVVERAMRDLVAPYDVVVIDGGLLPRGRLLPAWAAVSSETIVVTRADLSRKQAVAEALAAANSYPSRTVRAVLIES